MGCMYVSFKQECQKLLDHYVTCYKQGDAIGRQAIEDTHAEWVTEGAENKKIIVSSASRDGDLGWCIAEFSEGTTGEGVSLNVLARQPDDSWLITHCSLNEALS
mgnify:CR=1 FL=1